MDVDSIPAGQDFREYIRYSVQQCDVLVAVIGKSWLTSVDEHGRRRLDDPHDFVRLEVEAALERRIPCIPLLIGTTKMPQITELAEPLQELTYRHSLTVRPGKDFRRDIQDLIDNIARSLEFQGQRKTRQPEASLKARLTWSPETSQEPLVEPPLLQQCAVPSAESMGDDTLRIDTPYYDMDNSTCDDPCTVNQRYPWQSASNFVLLSCGIATAITVAITIPFGMKEGFSDWAGMASVVLLIVNLVASAVSFTLWIAYHTFKRVPIT